MTTVSIKLKTGISFMIAVCSCISAIIQCGAPENTPPEAARQATAVSSPAGKISGSSSSDTLRLLIWEGHAPRNRVDAFEQWIESEYKRNVILTISYVTGSDDFYNAVRNGSTDLIMMTHHHFKDKRYNYITNRLLLPLNLENIPNFEHVIPALKRAEHLFSNGKVYASPVSQGPYGLAYNMKRFKGEPESWNILWDPRFKGQYAIGANEYIYNANITALALGYPRHTISNFDSLNNDIFRAKLKALAVNAHSLWIGVDKPGDLSGRTLATSWGDALGPLRKQGEPWKMAEPVEGMPCWIDNYAVTWTLLEKPFLKKVAEQYINMLLSPDYQVNHITRKLSLTPIITNIHDLLTATEKKRIHIGSPNFFSENRILQHTYSQRDRNGLKQMWNEALKARTGGQK